MGITHVMRGDEWINSTPKHVLLYRYFEWEAPEFIHLPLLRNPDKSKLSKRRNPTSILYYRDAGFLPEALLNYLGLMAYSMPDGREVFALRDMVDGFDVDRISLGGPVFDLAKLMNFNGRYLRAISGDELADRLSAWMLNSQTWRRIVPLAQPRMNQLADLVPMSAFLFADRLDYPAALLISEPIGGERTARLLKIAQWEFEKSAPWTGEAVKAVFNRIAEKDDIKLKDLLMPFFVAMTGTTVSLPIFDSMEILGRDRVVRRLQYAQEALTALGFALSGKALKKLESEYQERYG